MDSQTPSTPPEQKTTTEPVVTPPSSNVPPAPPVSPPPGQTPPPPPNSSPTSPTVPPAPVGKSKKPLLIAALLIIAVGVGLLAFWYMQSQQQKPTAQAADPEPSKAIAPHKLIVGTDPTYPPMEYMKDKKIAGYDIDLANFIGKEMGTQIEFKNVVFDDLFTSLEKKEIDMIISTVTVTDERKQKYDFSEPYLQGGQVILTKKVNATITSTASLKGKKIGVQKGTTMETEAQKYTTDTSVMRYPDNVQATAALIKGDVEAIFADLPSAKSITNDNPTLKIASDPFTQEYYAIVFRKGDPSITEINKALASLKIKGILADLKQQWLDTE